MSARRPDQAGPAFVPTLPGGARPAAAAASAASSPALAGLDALIALQAVDADRPRGRGRAIRTGHDLLDVLEDLKIGLLSGRVSGSSLDRLASILARKEPSGDASLDALLDDIALRAEVEMAKLGRFLSAAAG